MPTPREMRREEQITALENAQRERSRAEAARRREALRDLRIEEDEIVTMGKGPESAGFECSRCQYRSGLAYSDAHAADRALSLHQESRECQEAAR